MTTELMEWENFKQSVINLTQLTGDYCKSAEIVAYRERSQILDTRLFELVETVAELKDALVMD